jgi:DNA modification methylase
MTYQIEHVATEKLVPYARNSRTHSDEQVQQIMGSIKEFGFTNPVLIDADGVIIAGHGRTMAAQRLGMKEVPCLRLSHLTDAQKRAYVIADNKLALNAGWDDEALANELRGLRDEDFDLSLTGFDDDELSALLADAVAEGLTDEDAVPEAPEQPVTTEGDVWLLGRHRLMCGDSTSIDAVEKLLDGRKADMVFTDPPYGVDYQSNMRTKSEKFDVLKNDDTFLDIAPIIEAVSLGWVFVWTSWKVLPRWLDQMEAFGYPTNQVIWFKGGGGIGDLKKTFSSDYETALVWNRGAELTGKRIGSVWKVGKDGAASYVHPTQKPVELGVEAINKTTHSGASVLDLFGGSGSTLIACEKTARDCRMMELDPKYCDVIIKRWQDFTGQEATHKASGETYAQLGANQCKAD